MDGYRIFRPMGPQIAPKKFSGMGSVKPKFVSWEGEGPGGIPTFHAAKRINTGDRAKKTLIFSSTRSPPVFHFSQTVPASKGQGKNRALIAGARIDGSPCWGGPAGCREYRVDNNSEAAQGAKKKTAFGGVRGEFKVKTPAPGGRAVPASTSILHRRNAQKQRAAGFRPGALLKPGKSIASGQARKGTFYFQGLPFPAMGNFCDPPSRLTHLLTDTVSGSILHKGQSSGLRSGRGRGAGGSRLGARETSRVFLRGERAKGASRDFTGWRFPKVGPMPFLLPRPVGAAPRFIGAANWAGGPSGVRPLED